MSIATVSNRLIHYEVVGRGKPVLFVHGWLGSWRYWWPTMQSLAAQHRTLAVDLWGFGDSSKQPHLYNLPAYVALLRQFLNYLGVAAPVTLVGHGLGAAVALRFTLAYPEEVERLATVALPVHGHHLDPRLAQLDPESYSSKVLGKPNQFSELIGEIHKTDPRAMRQSAGEILQASFASDLLQCTRPLLMLHGSRDRVVTPPTAEYQNQLNGHRHYVTLEECDHFPMLQAPAQFSRLLLDFSLAGELIDHIAPKIYWQRRTR